MSHLNKVKKVRRYAEIFGQIETTGHLADFLGIAAHQLTLMAQFSTYRCFAIPKKDGSKRFIEDPQQPLKKILLKLNTALQCGYFCHKTHAAYGFMINPDDDPDPRNILTNAQPRNSLPITGVFRWEHLLRPCCPIGQRGRWIQNCRSGRTDTVIPIRALPTT